MSCSKNKYVLGKVFHLMQLYFIWLGTGYDSDVLLACLVINQKLDGFDKIDDLVALFLAEVAETEN